MTERIRGQVAKVTSDRELMINRGESHGVRQGMHFYVKAEPIEVIDPATNEVLGEVAPIKVVVQVAEVAEKFCIARTFRTRRRKVRDEVKGGSLFQLGSARLDNMLQPPRPAEYETTIETLRMDPRGGERIGEAESVVKVGDVAELVADGEDINPVTTTLFR